MDLSVARPYPYQRAFYPTAPYLRPVLYPEYLAPYYQLYDGEWTALIIDQAGEKQPPASSECLRWDTIAPRSDGFVSLPQ